MVIIINKVIALIIFAGLMASGCSAVHISQTPNDRPLIVVSVYPFEYLASKLAPHAAVTNLTLPGTEPHDLELTPKQLQTIAAADLVIYQAGFQPAVDDAIASLQPAHVIDLKLAVSSLPADDSDEAADHHDEESDHDHANDPHTWLSPTQMQAMANSIAAGLVEVDKSSAAALTSNLADLNAELEKLDIAYKNQLARCRLRAFVTTHDAFGYLAHDYDLTQIPLTGLDPTLEPSPARLAEVAQLIQAEHITTIFFEVLVSEALAAALANDLGLRTDILDPIEGINSKSKGSDYLEVMYTNLDALMAANDCR